MSDPKDDEVTIYNRPTPGNLGTPHDGPTWWRCQTVSEDGLPCAYLTVADAMVTQGAAGGTVFVRERDWVRARNAACKLVGIVTPTRMKVENAEGTVAIKGRGRFYVWSAEQGEFVWFKTIEEAGAADGRRDGGKANPGKRKPVAREGRRRNA